MTRSGRPLTTYTIDKEVKRRVRALSAATGEAQSRIVESALLARLASLSAPEREAMERALRSGVAA